MVSKTNKKLSPDVILDSLIDLISVSKSIQENPSVTTNETLFNDIIKKKREESKKEIDQYNEIMKEAIACFEEKNSNKEIDLFLENFKNSQLNSGLINTFLDANKNSVIFENLLMLAGEAFESGLLRNAKIMFSMIASLFPLRVKPYIFLATIEWQENGIDSAIAIYEILLSTFKSHFLCFCAADCFEKKGDKERAKSLLNECLDIIKTEEKSEMNSIIQSNAEESLKKITL